MKKKRRIIEKKFQKEVKEIKEKREQPTLEKEIFKADEEIDLKKLAETIRAPKTAVLERVVAPQRKVELEDQIPKATQAKKGDDVKYGSKVEYGTNREGKKNEGRQISYQNVTEYVSAKEQNRRIQNGEAFDPNMMGTADLGTNREFSGKPQTPDYIARNDKRNIQATMRDSKSDYEVRKRKYQ